VVLDEIFGVNLILSGDYAVLIALAAAGLPADQRAKAILLESYPLIVYIGVALIIYIGVEMVYEDVHRFFSGETSHGEYRESPVPPIGIG